MYLRVKLVMADSVAMQIIVGACVVADSPRCVQCCFSVAVSPGHRAGRAEWKTDMRTAILILYTCTYPDDVRREPVEQGVKWRRLGGSLGEMLYLPLRWKTAGG